MIYLITAWVKEPTTGWFQIEVDTSKVYENVDEAVKDFASSRFTETAEVLYQYPRLQQGNVCMYRVGMRTKWQLKHPESNQVVYEAEFTFMEEE